MAQYVEFAIGDEIAHHKGGMEYYQLVFGGATPREDGSFDIQTALFKSAGYGGMGASLTWNVKEGDRIRLGHNYKAYEEPKRKKKAGRITALYFHKIETDCLTISYDWM